MSLYSSDHRDSRSFSLSASYASSITSASSKWSTIWGPGTLSGKALEALGEATLRGVENLVIRRKLTSLRSIFPHKNDALIRNIECAYDDVLELSRPELYPQTVRRIAVRLLLSQIEGGETNHLIKALERWPEIEIRFFLSQIMSECLLDLDKWHDKYTDETRRKSSSAGIPKASLRFVPVINFISVLAQHNDSAQHAALEGGFLDMLLRIYVVLPIFYISTTESTTERRNRRSALLDACKSALDVLFAESRYFDIIFSHPVYDIIWLRFEDLVPNYVICTLEEALDARCVAWTRTKEDIIKRRLMTIWNLPSSLERGDRNAQIRTCMDVVEFSRPQSYSSHIVEFALLTMFKYITTGSKVVKHLIMILDRHLGQGTIHAISGIIRLCLKCADAHSVVETGLFGCGETIHGLYSGTWDDYTPLALRPDPTFHDHKMNLFLGVGNKQALGLPGRNDALFNVIDFIVAAAGHSITFRQSLLDAGALALVLITFADGLPVLPEIMDAFVGDADRSKSGGEQVAKSSCISISVISTQARKLLDVIQTPALQSPLQSQMFIERRQLCHSLVDALLEQRDVDDAYRETRMLFDKIIG